MKLKGWIAAVCTAAMLFSTVVHASFDDVSGHWAEENINFVTENQLFSGMSDKKFMPDSNMTRAMFVTVLGRYAQSIGMFSKPAEKLYFSDVPENTWYSEYVGFAVSQKVVNGYGDGRFGPEDNVTREQMCVILVNFVEKVFNVSLESYNKGLDFADKASISPWAERQVSIAKGLSLINGKENNSFASLDFSTRAEVASVIKRVSEVSHVLKNPDATAVPAQTPLPSTTAAPDQKPSTGGGGGGGSDTSVEGAYMLTVTDESGNSIYTKEIEAGEAITFDSTPSKDGSMFTGYYYADTVSGGNVKYFVPAKIMPAKNITVSPVFITNTAYEFCDTYKRSKYFNGQTSKNGALTIILDYKTQTLWLVANDETVSLDSYWTVSGTGLYTALISEPAVSVSIGQSKEFSVLKPDGSRYRYEVGDDQMEFAMTGTELGIASDIKNQMGNPENLGQCIGKETTMHWKLADGESVDWRLVGISREDYNNYIVPAV